MSGAELLQFILWIASEQYGHQAYPQQKSFQNNIYQKSVNMVLNLSTQPKGQHKYFEEAVKIVLSLEKQEYFKLVLKPSSW